MDCASCGRANRAAAKFCGGCGRPLAPRCPACGSECQPGAQFCDACGASLVAAQADAAEARKVVTIVFADLIGSTALHERLDAESARRLMDRYHRSMGAVVEAHGGTVMQLLGDGVLAGFGVPRVAEDDAIRAVRAAVGMQQAFRALAREQVELAGDAGLRVAVYTGEVVAGDDHTHVMGDPVNVAARLQQEARDGDVLLGESTQRLVSERVTLAPFGSFTLKGRAEPVAAYRVVSLDRPAGAPAIGFVGREDELRRITAVYDTAVATRAARLAVILGSPGLGKSRLIDEFSRRLGAGATVLLAHCDAAGGATFAPLAEALRGLLRIDDGTGGDALRTAILSALPEGEPERVRIAEGVAALLAGTPASPEEIFFVVRRGLAALAAVRPVVLAIDDIQWAEPLLHDLIEHLVQWGSDVPLLVLAAARPELRDTRSSLATPGGLVSEVVTLAGLDAGAATRLAANVIGAEALPAAIAGRVLATSEGNPLFVGELVRMLVHDGALKREGDRWTAGVEVADLEMPPTIHALLAARIERLRPEERMVLERAAVIGRHFSRASLAQLLPREISDLDARLESLRRSELVEPDTGWFLGEPALRFHHVLIRDAAYRRLLKNTRAELHGRFADWLEKRAAGAVEHDETLGWHLEQAHEHLRELGPIDAEGRAFGERAVRYLAAAGRRALARDDLRPAASLLERALGRLDAADPARAELALDWCEALLSAGDVGAAVRAIDELGRFTTDSDRLRAWHTCFSGQLAVLTDPKALRASAEAVEAAAATLTSAADAAGEAKAHSVHALVLAQLGKIGGCEAALDKALAAARRARDRRRANAVLAGAPVAALWGPSPVTRASGRCLDVVRVLRITQGAPAVEAVALRCQAVLETLRGRAEAARRMIASSRSMVEELGITQRVLEADLFAGLIELLEGDAAAAERFLRVAYDGLRAQGLGIDAAQAAALLGRALLAQGRIAEAEAISLESESLAGDSFKAAIAWRGVRAEALAARGEHAAAIEFARAGVEIAAATDDLLDHADARQALAVALRAAGRRAEVDVEEKRAIELWEAKGATLLAERARRKGSSAPSERVRDNPARVVASVARFDELTAESSAERFPNTASGVVEDSMRAMARRDWDALVAFHAPGHVFDDRRSLVRTRVEGEAYFAHLRILFRNRRDESRELLATRGDRLALQRTRFTTITGQSGPAEFEMLNLIEVDAFGRQVALVTFDPQALDTAYAELDARYHAGEAAPHARVSAGMREFKRAFAERDWDALAARCAPDLVVHDRRLLGWETLHGPAAYLDALRSLVDLAPDTKLRIDHSTICEHGYLVLTVWEGTREGGAYEAPSLMVAELDGQSRICRFDQYDLERLAEARARYAELRPDPLRIPPNAATRIFDRWREAFEARDWPALGALCAPTLVYESRRRMDLIAGDRETFLANSRLLAGLSHLRIVRTVLATVGDRLVLEKLVWTSDDGEVEVLQVVEVDAEGRFLALVGFDLDDRRAASAELLVRDPHNDAVKRAMCDHDLDRLRAALPADFVFHDRRRTGLGKLENADDYIASLAVLFEQAPDVMMETLYTVAVEKHGNLSKVRRFGTLAGGGAFESVFVRLASFRGEQIVGVEMFELEDLEAARARFAELRPDPLRIPPNAATRASDRNQQFLEAHDWDALARLTAPTMEFEDRRRGIRVTGDRDMYLASMRMVAGTLRMSRTLLATAGDRVALQRLLWAGEVDGAAIETEVLSILEVDADDRIVAIITFDLGDRRAASLEMLERYFRGEGARWIPQSAIEVVRALNDHDLGRLRAALPDGYYFHDHRRTGVGRMENADDYVASIRAVLEQSRDMTTDTLYYVAVGEHGALSVGGMFGTLDGGGEFESLFVRLSEWGVGTELFELEDLDLARARFEAIRA